MAEKERFTTTIDGELLIRIRILAINKRCSANDLIEEAISEILEKYEKKPVAVKESRSAEISQPAIHERSARYYPESEE